MLELNKYLTSKYSKGNNQRMYNLLGLFLLVEKWASYNSLLLLFNNKHEQTTRRFLNKLVDLKFLYRNELKTDAHINKFVVYRLTRHALSLLSDDGIDCSLTPTRMSEIAVTTLMHSIDLQCLHAKCIHLGYKNWFKPDYAFKKKNNHYSDAIAELDGKKYSFEIERYLKSPGRYNKIFSGHAESVYNNTADVIYYVCPDLEMADKIRAYFESIPEVKCNGEIFKTNSSLFNRFKYVDYSFFGMPV
jgi:hypothetical protein